MIIKPHKTINLPLQKTPDWGCPNCIYLGEFDGTNVWLCFDDISKGKYKEGVFIADRYNWNPTIDFQAYYDENPIEKREWALPFEKAKQFATRLGLI